jgi:hypothetical protein
MILTIKSDYFPKQHLQMFFVTEMQCDFCEVGCVHGLVEMWMTSQIHRQSEHPYFKYIHEQSLPQMQWIQQGINIGSAYPLEVKFLYE